MVAEGPGIPLTVQREMIDEGKVAGETTAGRRLYDKYSRLIQAAERRNGPQAVNKDRKELREGKPNFDTYEMKQKSLMERRDTEIQGLRPNGTAGSRNFRMIKSRCSPYSTFVARSGRDGERKG